MIVTTPGAAAGSGALIRIKGSTLQERGQQKLRSAKEGRCALSVPPCETGGARSRRDEDGDWREGRKGGPRRSGQRSPHCASGRVQRPCNEECGQREGELECESEEECRLEGRRPRNVPGVDEPLEELLDDERDQFRFRRKLWVADPVQFHHGGHIER